MTSTSAQYNYSFHENVEAEDFTINLEVSIGSNETSFLFSVDEFIENDESQGKEALYYFLIESGVDDSDAESMIIDLVLLACDASNSVSQNFTGVLQLSLHVSEEPDQQLRQAVERSFSDTKIRFKPASKLAVKSLSRTKFKKRGVGYKKCMICLTKFVVGVSMASLPCGHVFHDGCIVEWLVTSHLCPLCRFELPCEDESEQEFEQELEQELHEA